MTSEHTPDISGLKTTDGTDITLTEQAQKGLARLASAVKNHKTAPCVLIIDNNAPNHALVMEAFRAVDDKINVQVMEDDRAAIDYLEGRGNFSDRARYPVPTTIILDLATSRTSGINVLNHIRAHPHLENSVVVALKETVSKAAPERCPGVTACLLKPGSQANFVEMIHGLRSSGLI